MGGPTKLQDHFQIGDWVEGKPGEVAVWNPTPYEGRGCKKEERLDPDQRVPGAARPGTRDQAAPGARARDPGPGV